MQQLGASLGQQFQSSLDSLKLAQSHQEVQLHTGIEELKRLIMSSHEPKKRKGDTATEG